MVYGAPLTPLPIPCSMYVFHLTVTYGIVLFIIIILKYFSELCELFSQIIKPEERIWEPFLKLITG